MFRPGHNYVKAGVILVDLQAQARMRDEPDLFGDGTPQPTVRRTARG